MAPGASGSQARKMFSGHFPRQKIGEKHLQLWALRPLAANVLTDFFSRESSTNVLCRKRPRGLSGQKCSNRHFPRQKIGVCLERQWASRLLAVNVLTVFMSGTSTTEVLWRQRPRGLRHAKCSVVTSLSKKSVRNMCSCGPRGLLRQMFSPFFCREHRRPKCCAARGSGPQTRKMFSGHFPRQEIGAKHEELWASRPLATNVLTVFLSGKSTTDALCSKGPRGLSGLKCTNRHFPWQKIGASLQ